MDGTADIDRMHAALDRHLEGVAVDGHVHGAGGPAVDRVGRALVARIIPAHSGRRTIDRLLHPGSVGPDEAASQLPEINRVPSGTLGLVLEPSSEPLGGLLNDAPHHHAGARRDRGPAVRHRPGAGIGHAHDCGIDTEGRGPRSARRW